MQSEMTTSYRDVTSWDFGEEDFVCCRLLYK